MAMGIMKLSETCVLGNPNVLLTSSNGLDPVDFIALKLPDEDWRETL